MDRLCPQQLFGMIAADLTARSGTLGPAIALHFVLELFAPLVCLAFQITWAGLRFLSYDFSIMDEEKLISLMPYDAAFLLLAYLSVRIALRR